jgi:small-conductance mechanosensitive channel
MDWSAFAGRTFWGNTLSVWAVALLVTLGVFAVLKLLHLALVRYLGRAATRTTTKLDDGITRVVRRTKWFFFVTVAVYWGTGVLDIDGPTQLLLSRAAFFLVIFQVGLWASSSVRVAAEIWAEGNEAGSSDGARATFAAAFGFLSNLVIWALVAVFVLSNLGVEVSALLAGLGVGGIAVALAAQNILGDLFASVAIYLDRPFDLGDAVRVDDLAGTVESVGLRSSRIRASTGELVIFPNRKLVEARVRNFRRMTERMISFPLAVTYGTPADKLESIPETVRRAAEGITAVQFERCHFRAYAESWLEFEVSVRIASRDAIVHASAIHELNLAIYRAFEGAGIAFAFPTRTVHTAPQG